MRVIKWLKGITTPTSSRWGIFTILLTAGFALIAVAVSVWEVSSMLDITPQTATILFWLGISAIVLGVIVGIVWLITGHRDTTTEDIKAIRKMLEEERGQRQNLQSILTALDWIISKFTKGK